MSASRLVRAAQGQVINLLKQIEALCQHVSALQAELDKAKAILASIEEDGTEERNAALGLRRELATERARLDWLEKRGPWESWKSWNDFGETGITLRENIRAAIDKAMKERAK